MSNIKVLIVPVGIETRVHKSRCAQTRPVLIVPVGIETGDDKLVVQVSTSLNRTSWN